MIKYKEVNTMAQPLAIGIDDFRKIREEQYYYIDKTLMIQDFLTYKNHVSLITRPRRFGKSLNMSMLRDFFDLNQDSKAIFSGLKIMETKHAQEINTRPVILLGFKNCNGLTVVEMKNSLARAMLDEYLRYEALFKSVADETDHAFIAFYETCKEFKKVLKPLPKEREGKGKVDDDLLKTSLTTLTQAVSIFYNHPPLLLIDEYDQPLIKAHEKGFREEFSTLYGSFLGSALKSNRYLGQALLTGIQRVVKESIFSELNNFRPYTVSSKKYAPYFGLTIEETKQTLIDYDQDLSEEIQSYYDGYIFGGINIYNPWSILSYLDEGDLKPYWVNTSTNGLIKESILNAGKEFTDGFEELIMKGEIKVSVNLEASFIELVAPQTLWGLLVNSGYLTVTKTFPSGSKMIAIPNMEVKEELRKIVAIYTRVSTNTLNELFDNLIDQDMSAFLKAYQKLVDAHVSYFNVQEPNEDSSENSFQMLFLGMAISTSGMYEITSEAENGDGRSDVMMKSLQPDLRPHIIVEFKYGENLQKLRQEALDQILEKRYYAKLSGKVLCVGIAHNKKKCELTYQEIMV